MTDTQDRARQSARQDETAWRLRAWAECVSRLMAVAPIAAVIDEAGLMPDTGHSTPPERTAVREAARQVVAKWLERDLAALEADHD